MKRLSALFILLLVGSWSQPARAQTADSWVSLSLKGDELAVWVPKGHEVKSREFSFEQFKLNGRVYTATSEGVDLSVWSFVDEHGAANAPASEAYLDACADLVWESLLKPHRDQVPKNSKVGSRMSFARELSLDGLPPGREYAIWLGGRRGQTRFFVADRQIYALIVLNLDTQNLPAAQRFMFSFGPKTAAPPPANLVYGDGAGEFGPGAGAGVDSEKAGPPAIGYGSGSGTPQLVGPGVGPGRGGGVGTGTGMGSGDRAIVGGVPATAAGDTDYKRIFTGRDVTQKARVLSKPEPQYTESARKYSVQGTVILRAVFTGSGEVNNIKVVKGLPHGLTERALRAAREIKFSPAQKDGRDVSMFLQLEYNFNLY